MRATCYPMRKSSDGPFPGFNCLAGERDPASPAAEMEAAVRPALVA
jgi:hypothetical protein